MGIIMDSREKKPKSVKMIPFSIIQLLARYNRIGMIMGNTILAFTTRV